MCGGSLIYFPHVIPLINPISEEKSCVCICVSPTTTATQCRPLTWKALDKKKENALVRFAAFAILSTRATNEQDEANPQHEPKRQ